jgi:hypothetical protein
MFDNPTGNGFHITFANGWTASVQWGGGNYCDNHLLCFSFGEKVPPSKTAEVWCWGPKGVTVPEHLQDVQGYLSPNEVLAYITEVSSLPSQ